MDKNNIRNEMEKLPVDVRAKCLLTAVLNIYQQAQDDGIITWEDIETCLESAWQSHKVPNEKS